ncbi:MAG TPA: hypothetical protein VM262_19220 [Acidimicrobiales bacterium]|nr:hypothetical protein [Acidimicrobiales bacterium]
MSFRRMAAWFGVAFVAVNVIGFALGGSPPAPEDGPAEIVRYIEDGGSTLKVGLLVSGLGMLLFLVYIAGFVAMVRSGDRARGEAYGLVVLLAAVLAAGLASVGLLANAVLALRGVSSLEPATTRLTWDLSMVAYGLGMTFVVPLGLASAVAVLQRGLLPRWFGYLSVVVGVLGFSGFASVVYGSNLSSLAFAGYAGLLVWVLAGAVALLREAEPQVA